MSIPALSRTASNPRAHRQQDVRLAVRSIASLALLSLLGASSAQAADDKAWIDYRQKLMSSIGSEMGAIGDILKNGLPLIPNIENHASAIAQSSRLIASAFEQKVVAGPTDARPEIWSDTEKFKQAIQKMQSEAELLAAAVGEGNTDQIPARVKALGQSCGGCHESFRKPKEESYKNK